MTDTQPETAVEQDQSAQEFELPDRPLPASPIGMFGAPQGGAFGSQPRASSRGSTDRVDIKTLEDVYVAYPQMGRGDWKIRVERTHPKTFRGCSTSGFIGDFYDRYSMEDFMRCYGGGRYTLKVMRPVESADHVTKSDYRTVKELRLVLPGDPTLEGIPQHNGNEDDMTQRQHPIFRQPSDAVEIERIKLDRSREEREHKERLETQRRLEAERDRSTKMPEVMQTSVMENTRRIFDDHKDLTQSQLTFWQQEVDRIRAELAMAKQRNEELREKYARAEMDASNTTRQIETAAIREMRERYDDRMREMKERYEEERRRRDEEHAAKLERLTVDSRRSMDEMTRRYDEERRSYEAQQTLERERTREDSRSRIADVERQKESEMRALRETYEARISDMRESSRQQIEGTRTAEQASANVVRENAQNRVALLEAEVLRLTAAITQKDGEINALRTQKDTEVNALRDRIQEIVLGNVKDPMTAISETKEMATILGMVEASEANQGTDRDWKERAFDMGEKFVASIPEMMEKVTENRRVMAQQQQQQQQRVVVSRQPPQQMQQQQRPTYQPPAMQMPPQQQQQQRQVVPTQPPKDYAPPPFGAVSFTTMSGDGAVPISPAVVQVPSPIQPGGDSAETGANPFGAGADGSSSVAVDSGPVTVQQQTSNGQVNGGVQVQADHMVEFFKNLEMKIAEKVVSPALFASGFVDRVGPQVAMQLLADYSPERIIDWARKSTDGESRIVTRDGQKYVHQLFGCVNKEVQRRAQAQAQVS